MTRKPREEAEGALHHAFAHGIDDKVIFRDDFDRLAYLRLLEVTIREYAWLCLSFCLMDTHMHLLIETPVPNLGEGMRFFHGEYAQAFNKRYARRGHLFEKRYDSRRIKDDAHLQVVARYIANNPVAAGMAAQPEAYRWSSHGPVLARTAPDWLAGGRLLEFFSANGGEPLERYRRFVAGDVEAAPLLRDAA